MFSLVNGALCMRSLPARLLAPQRERYGNIYHHSTGMIVRQPKWCTFERGKMTASPISSSLNRVGGPEEHRRCCQHIRR